MLESYHSIIQQVKLYWKDTYPLTAYNTVMQNSQNKNTISIHYITKHKKINVVYSKFIQSILIKISCSLHLTGQYIPVKYESIITFTKPK